MANLRKNASGNLLKNADGNLILSCARECNRCATGTTPYTTEITLSGITICACGTDGATSVKATGLTLPTTVILTQSDGTAPYDACDWLNHDTGNTFTFTTYTDSTCTTGATTYNNCTLFYHGQLYTIAGPSHRAFLYISVLDSGGVDRGYFWRGLYTSGTAHDCTSDVYTISPQETSCSGMGQVMPSQGGSISWDLNP